MAILIPTSSFQRFSIKTNAIIGGKSKFVNIKTVDKWKTLLYDEKDDSVRE